MTTGGSNKVFKVILIFISQSYTQSIPNLRLHPDYDPRKERATLLRLSDLSSPETNRNSSYSYLISLGKGESLSSILNNVVDQNDEVEKDPTVSETEAVINNVGNLMRTLSEEQGGSGLSSMFNDSSITFPSEKRDNFDAEPRIPRPTRRPVSVVTHRRSSPTDIVGFSAIRASGISRTGNTRIYFENTAADSNYGWDSTSSMFTTHFPGLYFFTFSVKADSDVGDNFKYEVSLMKNGEEIVSVGGAMEPSAKNMGISASNSVLLDLARDDKVWLQLLRGGLVETTNRRTGYSSFSGYKLGCQDLDDMQYDLPEDSEEEEEDPYQVLDIDRIYDNRRPSYPQKNSGRPTIYDEDDLTNAWGSDRRPYRPDSSDTPAHRPFDKNDGPPVVDRDYVSRPPSYDDDKRFNGYFNDEDTKGQGYSDNRRPGDQESQRRPGNSNKDEYWNRRPGYGNRDEDRNTRPEYDRRRPGYGDRDQRPDYDVRDRDRWSSSNRRRDPDGYYTDTSPVTSAIRDRYGGQEAADSRDKHYSNEDFFQKRHSLESRESHLSYGK